jgi:hypothetical protein
MKDMKTVMLGAFLVTLVAAVPARAQGVRPVLVNVGGGWTIPIADGKDRFDTGGNFNIGVLFAPEKVPFGFQVEYGYNGLSGRRHHDSALRHADRRRRRRSPDRVAPRDALRRLQRRVQDAG